MRRARAVRSLGIGGALLLSVAALPWSGTVPRTMAPTRAGLTPDSISGVQHQTTVVALSADMMASGKLLGSYTARLVWDSTVVRLDSVRAGAFGAPAAPSVNYVNGGELRLTQVSTAGMGGSFALAYLHFRFVNDTAGKRTEIQTTFSDFNATDFADLRPELITVAGVARILAPTVVVTFSPDSIRERVGFKPEINLTANLAQAGGAALGSYTASFTWDPAVMLLDSIRSGDFAAPQINQVSSGELRLTAAEAQGRTGGPFSLARLFFRFVNLTYPTETLLNLSVTELHEARTFADLLPGVSARSGKALIGGVLRGDVDISGSVAALDAQLILQGVVGLPLASPAVAVPNGDADCGGTLSARDAQIVLNVVVGNVLAQYCGGKIE